MNPSNIGPLKTIWRAKPAFKISTALLLLTLLAAGDFSGPAQAQEDHYLSAVRDYFRVSEQEAADALKNGVSEEELPVVFFIAQRAHLETEAVAGVRSSGLKWMEAAFHFHLNPWIFYTALPHPNDMEHTPLEKVYEAYQHPDNKIHLTDQDMINLVSLKFLSEYYRRDPKEIIQKRASGKTFEEINEDYWRNKDENSFQWDVAVPAGNSNPTSAATPGGHHHRGHSGGFSGSQSMNQ
jgi:hypothetical protein